VVISDLKEADVVAIAKDIESETGNATLGLKTSASSVADVENL